MNFRGAVEVMSVREVAMSGVGVIARVGLNTFLRDHRI
jgi:acyl CoA:acetate/3-ketoacid CoA transferase